MFRKINNKTLLVIFSILSLVAVIVYIYDQRKGERTFKKELFTVDSSSVTSITIYKKGSGDSFLKLSKTGGGWEIQGMKKPYPADSGIVKNILQSLAHVLPERVAGTDRTSWKEFEITDSLSIRVVVGQGNNVSADFRVGKISFSQDQNRQNYGGYRNMIVKSHIRVSGDDRVYVVDGYLSMMFSDDPARYRNRIVIKLDKSKLDRISFIYPGDSSFMLAKKGTKWYLNNLPSDSASTEQWINSIAFLSNGDFADEEVQPFNFPFTMRIEGNNMSLLEVKGAKDTIAKKYFIRSSANPSSLFASTSTGLFNTVFPGGTKFLEIKKSEREQKK